MTTATRNWFTESDGALTLELSVVVNGERLVVRSQTSPDRFRGMGYIPFRYIEHDMRRKLMASVEDRLLGAMR